MAKSKKFKEKLKELLKKMKEHEKETKVMMTIYDSKKRS